MELFSRDWCDTGVTFYIYIWYARVWVLYLWMRAKRNSLKRSQICASAINVYIHTEGWLRFPYIYFIIIDICVVKSLRIVYPV